MSTVGQAVDRLYRDFLHAGNDQPSRTRLTAAVDAIVTTWDYDPALFTADEEDLLAPGILVQAELEQALIVAVDTGLSIITVVRGVNGTEAAAHAEDEIVDVAPRWSRLTVLEALADNVVALWPTLYRVDTEALTLTPEFTEVPAEVVTPVNLVSDRFPFSSLDFRYIDNFPLATTTGKAITVRGVATDTTVTLVFRARFPRPTLESEDLVADIGLTDSWERIALIGTAAQLLAGSPEFDLLSTDFITEQLANENVAPGVHTAVSDRLMALHGELLERAAKDLRASTDPVVVYNAP